MGYKVLYKGLEVVCDSFEDLDSLAEEMGRRQSQTKVIETASITKAPRESERAVSSNGHGKMSEVVSLLPDGTIKLLNVILENNGSMTDSELRDVLHLKNNMQIAGRLSPIKRKAKKMGINPDSIISSKTLSVEPGNRSYRYSVPSSVKDAIQARKGAQLPLD